MKIFAIPPISCQGWASHKRPTIFCLRLVFASQNAERLAACIDCTINNGWLDCKTSPFEHWACTITLFMPLGTKDPQVPTITEVACAMARQTMRPSVLVVNERNEWVVGCNATRYHIASHYVSFIHFALWLIIIHLKLESSGEQKKT